MTRSLPFRPNIQSGTEFGRHTFGRLTIVFYRDIVSTDIVEYTFVAPLFEAGNGDPILYFTSERNRSPIDALMQDLGMKGPCEEGGSHFYCIIDGDGHSNYGASDAWADAAAFERSVLDELKKGGVSSK